MSSITVNNLVFDEYLSAENIAEIVGLVAERINTDYAGKEPLFICVLNGAFMYASDLLKKITLPAEITFVRLKSYEGTATTGDVKMLNPLAVNVEGKDVIVVEDIVDTGRTLKEVVAILKERNPLSLQVVTLLDKPERRKMPIKADYVGTTVPDEFIVGYGLDFGEKYRNLPFIGVLKREVYEK